MDFPPSPKSDERVISRKEGKLRFSKYSPQIVLGRVLWTKVSTPPGSAGR